ncbi:alanine/glycine:cation symporter family protein [Nesterenkonia halophila]
MNPAPTLQIPPIALGVDAFLERYFGPVAQFVADVVFFSVPIFGTDLPLIVFWLLTAGIFFTIWLKGLNVRGMKHAFDLVRGKYTPRDAAGEVTHFQALATALSGTVGLGNIAGVAIGISIGGPGAGFWIFVAGFFGMSTKMAECMMGTKYRLVHEDGTISGGPMRYLKEGLRELGFARIGAFLAVGWAVSVMLAALGVSAFQTNQSIAALVGAFDGTAAGTWLDDNRWVLGVVMGLLVAAVLIGGIREIAKVTEFLVPIMAVTYMIACTIVLAANFTAIPSAVQAIVSGAFTGAGATGGVIGALVIGLTRSAYSSAAGIGEATIAHSQVKTNRHQTEGFVASLEPFVDTIIVCSATSIAITVSGVWKTADPEAVQGITLTSQAFGTVSSWFPYILAIAAFLFAFSSILCYAYYGMKGFGHLFGESPRAERAYEVVVISFTVVGSSLALGPVVQFGDSLYFMMGIFNVIGLYFLANVIRRDFVDYWTRLKNGEFELMGRWKATEQKKSAARAETPTVPPAPKGT